MKKVVCILLVSIILSLFCSCGHKHEIGKNVIKEATCTQEGVIKFFCYYCDYTYEEKRKALGHKYDEGTVIVDNTCTTDGKIEYVCKTCNSKKEEVIPAAHKFDKETVREATCAEKGEKVRVCSVCGYKETEEIEKKEHNFSEETVREATCAEKGEKVKICSVCGYKETEEIEKKEHNFTEKTVKEATCTQNGEKVKECTVCGYKETEKIEKKKEHKFVNNKCIYCNALISDMKPDTWYHYNDISYINCQNCLIENASPLSNGFIVKYYPVCRECHVVSNDAQFAAPEYNYDITENYICSTCGAATRVKIKLSS